jgi:acyl-CoA oxidase
MNEERAKAVFNIRELTYLLDGGEKTTKVKQKQKKQKNLIFNLVILKKKYQLKERFMQDFERDPLFKMDDIHDITKDELRERTMEKVNQ